MKYLITALFFLCALPLFAKAVLKNDYYVVTITNNTNDDLPFVRAEGDIGTDCFARTFKQEILHGSTKAHQSMDLLIYVPKECLNKIGLYVAIKGDPGLYPHAYCKKIKNGTYVITGPVSTPVGKMYKCNGVLTLQKK